MKTLFERIIDREIPARIEFEDEHCIVIHDINPQAPVHLLIIPKKPVARVDAAGVEDEALLGHLILTGAAVAKKLGLATGYRLVIVFEFCSPTLQPCERAVMASPRMAAGLGTMEPPTLI